MHVVLHFQPHFHVLYEEPSDRIDWKPLHGINTQDRNQEVPLCGVSKKLGLFYANTENKQSRKSTLANGLTVQIFS